ncbi:MAG: pilus assembly protein [Chloroflexi bacterium]|nr:pilus assembly protein [Chloroflexota bacterium]
MTLKSSDRKERGQAMVEFALLLPIFLAVLFLIIDFGVGINRWVIVTNSTREGARIGAVGASTPDIADRVATTSNGLLDAADVTVRYVGDGDGAAERGESVVVESDYEYGLITPLRAFLSIAFDSITFHSCTDMRLELPVSGAVDSGGDVCS